jgi:hypothetical protein
MLEQFASENNNKTVTVSAAGPLLLLTQQARVSFPEIFTNSPSNSQNLLSLLLRGLSPLDPRQGARRPLHPLNRALWRKILLFFGNLRQNLHLTPACPPESSASGNHTVSSLDALPLFACGFFPLPVNANRGGNVPL